MDRPGHECPEPVRSAAVRAHGSHVCEVAITLERLGDWKIAAPSYHVLCDVEKRQPADDTIRDLRAKLTAGPEGAEVIMAVVLR